MKTFIHTIKLMLILLFAGAATASAQQFFRVIGGIPHLPAVDPAVVAAPVQGMLIYSTKDQQPLIYNGTAWESLCSNNINVSTVKDYLEVKSGIPYLSALTNVPAGNISAGGVYYSKTEKTMMIHDGNNWNSVAKLTGKSVFSQSSGFSTNSGLKISKLPVLGSNPVPLGLSAGAMYVNTVSRALRYYDGAVWKDISCLPVISTVPPNNITNIAARSGADIKSNGGSAIILQGICWSTSANPDTTLSTKTRNLVTGKDTGIFPGLITGLQANTVYHVRAYALNSSGIVYGEDLIFRSAPASLPDIITLDIDNFSPVMANSGGAINSDGGAPITLRGVTWSTTGDPKDDPDAFFTRDGSGVGTFPSRLTDLVRNTTYYVRAYADNIAGRAYGNLLQFTTPMATAPVLSSPNIKITDITDVSAVSEVTIINNGGETVIERGVCWSTDRVNYTYNPSTTVNPTDIGTFLCKMTGLTSGTLYYVKAYAKNIIGTSYSSETSFITTSLPTLTTIIPYNYDAASHVNGWFPGYNGTIALSGGDISSNGVSLITKRGIVWDTNAAPTIDLNTKTEQSINGSGMGTFYHYLTSLTPGSTYHVRAYATNKLGTAYGEEMVFKTPQVPILTTTAAGPVANTSLSSGGSITDDGRMPVHTRGLCWATTDNPTVDGQHTVNGSGSGTFLSSITGLMGSTTYYIRAYAINYVGIGYGATLVVKTAAPQKPAVTTLAASSTSGSTSAGGGEVTDNGGAEVTSRGLLWSSQPDFTPDLSSPNKTTESGGTGRFNSTINGLEPNKTYYVRAYAVNSAGAAYGEALSFKTFTLAQLITTEASSITSTTAVSGGDIFSDGGDKVTSSGIVWSTKPNPTRDLPSRTQGGTGVGSFIHSLTELMGNTTYYVRAYAVNRAGTAYGNEITFNTAPAILPSLKTEEATEITGKTVKSGGRIISNGGAELIMTGMVWSQTQGFLPDTVVNNKTIQQDAGSFISMIKGLQPGTTYYARAYAANSVGLVYGNEIVFKTASLATLTTLKPVASSITSTSATSGGTIISNGGSYIQSNGICWGTSPNPTLDDSFVVAGSGSGSFAADLKDLMGSTTYYVRAFATNAAGTAYGNLESLVTKAPVPLTIQTLQATNIKGTSASSGGNILSSGGALVSTRGVVWATSADFKPDTVVSSRTADTGYDKGIFQSNLKKLKPGTTYYVRAYASSIAGTVYGNLVSFSTPKLATITTNTPTFVSNNTAQTGGNISDAGGAEVTERGVVWSTIANFDPEDPGLSGRTSDGGGTGIFNSYLKDLLSDTRYYARAYAVTSGGTAFGQQVSFTTGAPKLPSLTTTLPSQVTGTTAIGGGEITDEGGAVVQSQGVVWSTQENFDPVTVTQNKTVQNGSGKGIFTSNIIGLSPGTTYYIRAYATNKVGTAYGNQFSFISRPPIPITVVTTKASSITGTSATSGGEITRNDGLLVSTRGILWSVYPDFNPDTITVNKTAETGYDKGVFTSYLKNLTPGTTYYVRAYAVSNAGTAYGEVISFVTADLATITTNSPGLITNTTADFGGNISYSGGSNVTSRGMIWSTVENFIPDLSTTNKTYNGSGTGSFTTTITGLVADTKYYFRAYAVNIAGVAYGQQIGITTYPPVLPELTTTAAVRITGTSASSGGNITDEGGVTAEIRGVVWSLVPNFDPVKVTTNRTTQTGAGKGIFVSNIAGLQLGTTYYIRAYASNRVGTAYGNELSFTTQTVASISTIAISANTGTTAMSGGLISMDGGAAVLQQGVVWSTSPNPTTGLVTKTSDAGSGRFNSKLTNLKPATTYYVRAYVINSLGTSYGNEIVFTTNPVLASLTTTDPAITSNTTASSGGTITFDGGAPITERGIVWSSQANFKPDTVKTNRTSDGQGDGTFMSDLTDLVKSTTYYVRAYATNAAGTAYGNQLTVTIFATSPILITKKVTSIAGYTAISGGIITSDGGATVTKRGIVWSTSQNPTIALSTKTSDPDAGDGTFSSALSGLQQNTLYYVRAYAINAIGVAYGLEESFFTLALPTLTATTEVTNIRSTTASSGGEITDDGRTPILSRGIVWSTYSGPTISLGTKTVDNVTKGIGVFSANMSGLAPNTTYYVRAYASNSVGVNYGSERVFKTNIVSLPTLTTAAVSSIQGTSAMGGGEVIDDGGMPVVTRGIVWSTSTGPTIALSTKIVNGTAGTGSYSNVFAGLVPGTTYYVRAYATNSVGTAYGNEVSFTSSAVLPTLSNVTLSNVKMTSADGAATLTFNGGAAISDLGFVWNTVDTIPATGNRFSAGPNGTAISGTISGLLPNTKYFVWAYGSNTIGTGYSTKSTVLTTPTLPTITTTKPSAITQSTASSGGTVTNDGGAAVTAKGIVWSTDKDPTTDLTTKTLNGTGLGGFASSITGLTKGTKYYVRAYAVNSMGTAYGNLDSLSTLDIPVLTTTPASNIASTSASSGGEITSDGGTAVTVRGVVWDKAKDPTIALSTKTSNGTGKGIFVSSLTPLSLATKYYFRAYATNSVGTAYGNLDSLKTPAVLPVVSVVKLSDMTETTVTGTSEVTYDGGADVTARGLVWNTTGNPTLENSTVVPAGTGTGGFSGLVEGLEEGLTFYIRGYATNSVGTGYSTDVASFQICKPVTVIHRAGLNGAPADKTITYKLINTKLSGASKCWITQNLGSDKQAASLGDATEAASGWYWQFNKLQGYKYDATGTRTPNNAWTPWINGNGENLNWVAANDPCTQLMGGGWRIPTSAEWAAVSAAPQSWTTTAMAYASELKLHAAGNTNYTGGLLARGTAMSYWSSTQNASTAYGNYFNGLGMTTADKASALPLRCLRDMIIKSVPTVTNVSAPVSGMTVNTAEGAATVTNDGGVAVTARGLVWNTTGNPTLDDNVMASGSGTGDFKALLLNLEEGPTYYVRAYATNSEGTAYSPLVTSFKICNPFTVIHREGLNGAPVDKTVTYKTISTSVSGAARCWIAQNLGADQQAISLTDNTELSSGWYWQFNKIQGFKYDVVTGARTPNYAWVPWITSNGENSNWVAAKDPCTQLLGLSWRLPTSTEWAAVSAPPQYWTATTQAYASELKLHAAGSTNTSGGLGGRGSGMAYWSSTQNVNTSYGNYFLGTGITTADKAAALPVRCLRDMIVKNLPTVTNVVVPVSGMTENSAAGSATVATDGGAAVTARGLVWNTTGTPTTADNVIALGASTGDISGVLSGLEEGPTYYVRAFATNSEGTAYSPLVTSFKICNPFTVIHRAGLNGAPADKTVTYKTVSTSLSGAARCWITQNLGSDQQAGALGDASEPSSGWYWQFNKIQGYKYDATGSRTPNNGWVPWINSNGENSNWLPANDPCILLLGTSWRLPTSAEWVSVYTPPQNWTTTAMAYASELKLHAAGNTNYTGGLLARGTAMSYWSSTQNASTAYGNYFNGTAVTTADKASALPVRCLRDMIVKSLPAVTNVVVPVSGMTVNTAEGSATVTGDGGTAVTARGLVWNTTGTPTTDDNIIAAGSGTGDFKSLLKDLEEGPTYYVRAFATNSAGTAYSTVVTSFKICNPFTVIHREGLNGAPVDKTVTYKTISTSVSGAARCWIAQNLGADQQAISLTDNTELSSGWYWQFNKIQGFKYDAAGARSPNNAWVPWITSNGENLSWVAAKDPCTLLLGASWRLPTSTEWAAVAAPPQYWTATTQAYASELKLHAAGSTNTSGGLGGRGSGMAYWSSTQNANSSYGNYFLGTGITTADKAAALPVRCLRDMIVKNLPTLTNVVVPVSGMTENSAAGSATVATDGGAAVTARGLVWNTTGTPTTADNVIPLGKNTGDISGVLNSLEEGPTYYVRAFATNSEGTAYSPLVTSFKICNPFTVIHRAGLNGAPADKTVTYKTVSTSLSGAARCWITQNLGSDQQATALGDATEASSGWYWQFNKIQGFKYDAAGARTPNNGWVSWITSNGESSNWVTGNDPCTLLLGTSWRLPTSAEWVSVYTPPQNWTTTAMAYASELKLHAAGNTNYTGGLLARGTAMSYWSSTQNASTAYGNYFNGTAVTTADKASALPVRCLRDMIVKSLPSVTNVTVPVADMTTSSAKGYATVTLDGGSAVTARGLVWNTKGNPTIADKVIALGVNTGDISGVMQNLEEGPTYYVRAFATNAAGTTYSPLVTSFKICNPFTVIHREGLNGAPVDKTVIYKTISTSVSGAARCWIAQNLGADQQAGSFADNTETSSGWYWQFNKIQGYKYDAPSGARTPNYGWVPWVGSNGENSSWATAKDPCALLLGASWRLPTSTEWTAVSAPPQYWTAATQAYASELKLHAAGSTNTSGGLGGRGSGMAYWSSTQNANTSYGNYFLGTGVSTADKGAALPVRCLRDTIVASKPAVTNVMLPTAKMTSSTAEGSATIALEGSAPVTSRGLVWNTTGNPVLSDFSLALGSGTGPVTGTLTGLTEGPTYYVRAYATNSEGTIYSPVVSSFKICNPLTVSHTAGTVAPVDKTVTYGTVSSSVSGAAKCWITQNLGADQQATALNDATEASAGWYWAFNRVQGFKFDAAGRTPTAAQKAWVNSNGENSSWTAANDPCTLLLGAGWRLPSSAEWVAVYSPPQYWTTQALAYASELKLHAAGNTNYAGGLLSRGTAMNYWSSTQNASTAYGNCFSGTLVTTADKASALPIRCLKD
ncbi:hypothetical protein [Pedobacter nutrimenti]|uniref:Fibronectin type-III domain-containing protein n=1 Tax=Pedobacter nutrimenti TaxID=1241337 RepID=A0A318U965_9SPHI|nr:hypothetical protein [Pedobacter nutrimenti]PYF71476.1 hypothetical protein B0O44_10791 [Pedobacter nutrimenti]